MPLLTNRPITHTVPYYSALSIGIDLAGGFALWQIVITRSKRSMKRLFPIA